jgi:hypothetical protein
MNLKNDVTAKQLMVCIFVLYNNRKHNTPMKNMNRITVVSIIACLLVVSTLISCDFVLEENTDAYKNQKEEIAIHIDEAKLLVEMSMINMSVLHLSQLDKEVDFDQEVKVMSNSFKREHFKLSQTLDEMAEDKLISLPDTLYNGSVTSILRVQEPLNSEVYLKRVYQLIKKQISSLETLSKRTTDSDFKTLSMETKSILEDELKEAERLITY